jgi:uncharacterized protein YcbK (DUF882 family)
MSCGAQQASQNTAASLAVDSNATTERNLPMLEVPMVATMSLVNGNMAAQIRAKFSSTPLELSSIPVTFRRGPRLPSRTFEIELDGAVDTETLKELRGYFRCRRSGRSHRISQGLLAKIADLAGHFEGHTIELVSAYRHGRYASRTSRHRHGRAIDIKVVGVPAVKVRDYLWARYEQEVGVGFYRQQQFIHLDHRTDYPATAWTQKSFNGLNTYKPGWSRKSRRDKLVVALAEASN